jgi:hypothetical protein
MVQIFGANQLWLRRNFNTEPARDKVHNKATLPSIVSSTAIHKEEFPKPTSSYLEHVASTVIL